MNQELIQEEESESVSHVESVDKQFQFRSLDHYLNTHFQLNREDCLAQLRRGIHEYRSLLMSSLKQQGPVIHSVSVDIVENTARIIMTNRGDSRIYMYGNVNVNGVEKTNGSIGYSLEFDHLGSKRKSSSYDWSRSNRFMIGSLLCLSPDGSFNEDIMVIATVLKSVDHSKSGGANWKPSIIIGISNQSKRIFDPLLTYVMIESLVFFEAYRPVLEALKLLGQKSDLPFLNILTGKNTYVGPPSYLIPHKKTQTLGSMSRKRFGDATINPDFDFPSPSHVDDIVANGWDLSAVFPDFEKINKTKYWNPVTCKQIPIMNLDPPLDSSQISAVAMALSKELTVIQGPPGTGKTFTGVLISKVLLTNKDLRARKPILYVCQTNHALDQMLENIYKFEKNIIRVGGKSESAIMQSLNLNQLRQNSNRFKSPDEWNAINKMDMSINGLKVSILQRQVLQSFDQNIEFFNFPNSMLARLDRILSDLNQTNEDKNISSLVTGNNKNVKFKAMSSCQKICKERAKLAKLQEPDWVIPQINDIDSWANFLNYDYLLLMATYFNSDTDYAYDSLVYNWFKSRTKKKDKNKMSPNNEWMEVKGKRYVYVSDDESEENSIDSKQREIYGFSKDKKLDIDNSEYDTDIDIDEEVNKRMLDDDQYDDDFLGDFLDSNISLKGYNKLEREESFIDSIVKRPFSLDINTIANQIGLTKSKIKDLANVEDIWSLSPSKKKELLLFWAKLLDIDSSNNMSTYYDSFSSASVIVNKFNAKYDSDILKSAAVIGMTTNGAAKYNALLRELQPEIIIIEEAAEVLEASVLASFTSSTKHVIFIGDHLQLRPQVSEYSLGTYHGLQISLFERLVKMNVGYVTLSEQRRMHPDISSLITPSIYSNLKNSEIVHQYPQVTGIQHRLFFISHTVLEDGQNVSKFDISGSEMSKTNSYEALFIIRLVLYLLYNEYDASRITVLCMYKGQLMLLKKLVKEEINKKKG